MITGHQILAIRSEIESFRDYGFDDAADDLEKKLSKMVAEDNESRRLRAFIWSDPQNPLTNSGSVL